MPKLIGSATRVPAPSVRARVVDEYVGLVNTGDTGLSITQMRCAAGWKEPAQCPRVDEYILVQKGVLVVEHDGGMIEVEAGQAVHVLKDEWVRYSTPTAEGAEYIAVCVPAFSPAEVRWNR